VLSLLLVQQLSGQNTVGLTVLSREGRRTIPLTMLNSQEAVALDDLAAAFQLTVREVSGAITVAYKSHTIILTPDQAIASIDGRLVSLAAPPARSGSRLMVPIDFISRALSPIYDTTLDLRRAAHLLVVGDLRVPRVTMRFEPLANAARLTIDAAPRAGSVVSQEPGRLLVRFDADALEASIPAIQPQPLLQAIRAVDAVTFAIEVGPRFTAARTSSEDIENTTRLVIDLLGMDATSTGTGPPPPGTPAAGTPAPGTPVIAAPPPAADTSVLSRPEPALRTIAIDAGHGGDDQGAKAAEGAAEKDLVLSVSRKLKAAIEARLGLRVLLTRDEDRNIPIDQRTAIANNSKADLFISLHANAALRPAPAGASIHVAQFNGSAEARAALAPERVPVFGGSTRDIELVEWDLAQIRYVEQSTAMARIIEQEFQGHVPLAPQPFGSGVYRVLESANMPAVLVELGYLSNPDQAKQLAGAEFQNAFVQAMVDSIVKFRDFVQRNADIER